MLCLVISSCESCTIFSLVMYILLMFILIVLYCMYVCKYVRTYIGCNTVYVLLLVRALYVLHTGVSRSTYDVVVVVMVWFW